jgi:hypothetical protein
MVSVAGVSRYAQGEETPRPRFKGKDLYDPHTQEIQKTFSTSQRVLRYAITVPVYFSLCVGVVYLMVGVFATRDALLKNYEGGHGLGISAASIVDKILSGWNAQIAHPRIGVFGESSSGSSHPSNSTAVTVTFSLRSAIIFDPYFWVVTLFYPSVYSILIPLVGALFYW